MRKAQILENRDKTERGDKIYYRTIEPSVLPEERIGATAGELMAIAPSISYIERPLPAKRKKPGLAKLVKRLGENMVSIHSDGSAVVIINIPENGMNSVTTESFNTLAALKEYLATLPEPEEKA